MRPKQFFILAVLCICFVLTGCEKRYESRSTFEISLNGLPPAQIVDELKQLDPTLTFSEVRNTSLIQASIKDSDAKKVSRDVNNAVDLLQKKFKDKNPKGTFTIWEQAEPDPNGSYW